MRSRLLVAAVGVPALLYVVLWGPPLLMLAALALLAGILLAWRGGSLFLVAVACCLVVFVSEWFLI